MNGLLKNVICGLGTVLVISPVKRVEDLNIDDYMHRSAEEAVHSDWVKVGRGLVASAAQVKSNTKRVEESS